MIRDTIRANRDYYEKTIGHAPNTLLLSWHDWITLKEEDINNISGVYKSTAGEEWPFFTYADMVVHVASTARNGFPEVSYTIR